MKKILLLIIIVVVICLPACNFDKGELPKPQTKSLCDSLNVTYTNTIAPIISAHCISCHKAGFAPGDFTMYSVVKAKADAGSLKNRVLILQDMPKGGPPLSVSDQQKIQCWLDAGSPNN